MNISKSMKRNVVSIPATWGIREATSVFVKHHIGLLPIVGKNNHLIGVVGLRDLLSLELPSGGTGGLLGLEEAEASQKCRPL